MSYQDLLTDDQVKFADDMWGVLGLDAKEFVSSCDVKAATFSEWLDAIKARDRVPHVMGELRKPLKADPEPAWRLA
jgi:hypothetical protein